uniref:Putative ribonuclease H-like domain-containing protein n=1 Tax=Tanacetum cinerariifolium TaxID=118510 RepID=A0A6L2NTR9_TANCI|nr:putative ribonuclease H-like domain-containing protein [Tanacetum cinerariifolium]
MARTVRDQGRISQIFNEDFHTCMFACFLLQEEPKRVHQALKDPSWIEAMQKELLQFKMQKVWILVDLLFGKRAIVTKWVYRNKKDERGIVIRNKARLVAQGHTQEQGINYEEVFAPVARIEAIRLFLAYASFIGFLVYQMDVKSAFLYGTIEEEVYICQPPGFEDPENLDKPSLDSATLNCSLPRRLYSLLLTTLYLPYFIAILLGGVEVVSSRKWMSRGGEQSKMDESRCWYQEPKFLFKMPSRRSEGEELKYPFFEGDGSSSDEWRDYDMAGDDYEGPQVFDDDQYEKELMPVHDTAIEDVIEEEEGFVEKGGFNGEEDNIEDVVVVANDLCSSMIQTSISVDFPKIVDSNPHELIWL